MIQPEEDYATWAMIVESYVDSISDFQLFVPDINRLLESIENTEELPEPIKSQKKEFVELISKKIIPRLLRFSVLDETSLNQIFEFLKSSIKFSLHGINTNNDAYVNICINIINKKDHNLFSKNTNFDFYQKIIDYMKEIEFPNACLNSLKSKSCSIAIINADFQILHAINEIDFWELADLCIQSLTQIINNEKMANISTTDVFNLCEQMRLIATTYDTINENFVLNILQIIKSFITSKIFEKRFEGFKGISYFISDQKTLPYVLKWFKENPSNIDECLNGEFLHTQFMQNYQLILSELAASEIISDDYIEKLWEFHKVQHSTQLFAFYLIFDSIAARLKVEHVEHLVKLCVNPNEINEPWINFMAKLGATIGKRNDSKSSFILIRNALIKIAFPQESKPATSQEQGENDKQTLVNLAQNALSQISQYYLTSEELHNLCEEFKQKCGDSILFFKLMQTAIVGVPFNNEEYCNDLLSKAVQYLCKSKEDHEIIYGFIFNLCFINKIKIPEELLPDLFANNDAEFFKFAVSCVTGDLVSTEFVENYILEANFDLTNDFYELVKNFIYKLNDFQTVLTKLPIVGEYLLWKLATTNSNQRTNFSNLLSWLYTMNDGVHLTDKDVINAFIDTWSHHFNNCTPEQRNDKYGYTSYMLQILRSFMYYFEDPIDVSLYNVTRHDPSYSSKLLKVTATGLNLPSNQVHYLPERMKMSAVKHRIAKTAMMPQNTFVLNQYQRAIPDTSTLLEYANKDREVSINIRILDADKLLPPVYERTCVPSIILSQNEEMMETLVKLVKENVEEARSLLELLPTIPSTTLKINEIQKKKSFNYNELLPAEYPLLFKYNFESLTSSFNDEFKKSFERTGGFSYLVDSLTLPLFGDLIPFLDAQMPDELMKKDAQKIFDKLYPSLLDPSIDTYPDLFNVVRAYIYKIVEIKENPITLNESLYPTIEQILFSEKQPIKDLSSYILSRVTIPLSAFTSLLDKANDDFYTAVTPHINEFNQELYDKSKSDLDSVPLLSVLSKFLELNVVPEGEKVDLTQKLIDRYLKIDSPPRSKESFTEAVKCLSYLSNETLLKHLQELHENKTFYTNWRLDGDSTFVSKTGFSGLINLGVTCFLNSTLQQFFAIPPLRKAIVEYNGTDDFMIQLRNLYAKMLLSNGRSVTTESLVKEWRGWDGEKMNPHVQQDACEFSQMLIDKLETGLGAQFVNGLFNGTTVDQIEGINEDYHSSLSQPFTTYQLAVAGYSNFEQAMKVKPDFLTGDNQYYDDKQKRKIDVKKFQRIGKLPPYLIIVLSRFSYNYYLNERKKIDDPFEFPLDLDLSEYTCVKDQETKYKLKGVIMHSGTAMFGHYISYVNDRKSGKWLCCNDSSVTYIDEAKVLENAYGKEKSTMNGFLLFYDRIDTTADYEPSISDETKQTIDKENRLHDEYSLYCSTSYFQLMKSLVRDENNLSDDYALIALKYFFDTYPCTTFINSYQDFKDNLVKKLENSQNLRNMFTEYILGPVSPFICSLGLCPGDSVRSTALKLLMLMNEYQEQFIVRVYKEMESIMPYYQCFNEFFLFIADIVKRNHDYAVNSNLGELLVSFITTSIPNYVKEHTELRPAYIYDNLNLTGIFNSISLLGLQESSTDSLIPYILSDSIFKNILLTPTENESLISLLHCFEKHSPANENNVDNFFINEFIPKSSLLIDFYKFAKLMFEYYGARSFEILSKGRFKTKEGVMTDLDLALSIAAEASSNPDFKNELLKGMNQWLLPLLISSQMESCIAISYAIAFIAPHEKFTELFMFPQAGSSIHFVRVFGHVNFIPAYLKDDEEKLSKGEQPSNPAIKSLEELNKVKETVIKNAEIIYNYLKENEAEAAKRITSCEQSNGHFYASIVEKLAFIIGKTDEACEFLLKLAKDVPVRKPADPFRRNIISMIAKYKPELITTDFVMESLGDFANEKDQTLFSRTVFLLEAFIPILDRFDPPDEFVQKFVSFCAFSQSPQSNFKYNVTADFIKKLAALHPEMFIDYIGPNFDKIVTKNFSSLLIVLMTTHQKMDVLKHLKNATSKKQYYNISDLVVSTFECNNGSLLPENVIDLVSILNNPELSEQARNLIWNVVYENKPSYEQFKSVFTWKGDYPMLVKYLLSIVGNNEETSKSVIEALILDCARNSIEALISAFEYLKANMADQIRKEDFVHSVLRLKVSPTESQHEDILEKFLLFIFEGRNEEQIDALLLPLTKKVIDVSRFLSDVLEDPSEGEINKNDIEPLLVPLRVFAKLQIGTHPILQDLGKLQHVLQSNAVKEKINLPEIDELAKIVRQVVLV